MHNLSVVCTYGMWRDETLHLWAIGIYIAAKKHIDDYIHMEEWVHSSDISCYTPKKGCVFSVNRRLYRTSTETFLESEMFWSLGARLRG